MVIMSVLVTDLKSSASARSSPASPVEAVVEPAATLRCRRQLASRLGQRQPQLQAQAGV